MRKRKGIILLGVSAVVCFCTGCGKKDIKNEYIEIKDYNKVKIEAEEQPQITEEDVMIYIEEMQQRNAVQKDGVNGPVENGDTVSIDFRGSVDGQEIEGSSETDYIITVGAGGAVEEFNESLVGHDIGDVYNFTGQLPEDYYDIAFAGKKVEFEIKINSISRPELPELNDEFVSIVSDKSKTVEEYKKEVREILQKGNEEKVSLEEKIWAALVEKTEVKKYPEKILKSYMKELIDGCKESAESFDMKYEEFVNVELGMTVEEYEQEAQETVQEMMKERMIIEAIGDKEKLQPDNKEYEKESEKLAQEYGYANVDEMKEEINEEELQFIVLKSRVLKWLSINCKI